MHMSYVLDAMRVPKDFAFGTLRLSVGRRTTDSEVDEAAALVADALERVAADGAPAAASL